MPDDLSWALFAYSGAASAAGQVYTGAVLCTPDGAWPAPSQENRINIALRPATLIKYTCFRFKCQIVIPASDSNIPASHFRFLVVQRVILKANRHTVT